jgi:hypothetical protein
MGEGVSGGGGGRQQQQRVVAQCERDCICVRAKMKI